MIICVGLLAESLEIDLDKSFEKKIIELNKRDV